MPSITLPQRGIQVATDGARPANLHGPARGSQSVAAGATTVNVTARCTASSVVACVPSEPAVIGVKPQQGYFTVTFSAATTVPLTLYWCIL